MPFRSIATVLFHAVEILALGFITVTSVVAIIRATRARAELENNKNVRKTFRQKVHDGDIRNKVDRPIRK